MSIDRLQISNLRNIQQIDFEPHPSLNLFYGVNGAGKTSILEAINLLSVGRSFRHRSARPLIRQGCAELTIFGETGSGSASARKRLGIAKTKSAETQIHIDGQPVNSAAQLAEQLPILNINAHSFELIGGPPKPRRQLLDWLTFHVEPLFLPTWRDLQGCLKQRNNLLRRDKIRPSELDSWDLQLTDLTAKIDSFRSKAFSLYQAALNSLGELLSDVGTVTVRYKKGWPLDQNYSELLIQQRSSDIQRGYTQSGPHRADLDVKAADQHAADSLSRGQTKVVVVALIIALGQAFKDAKGHGCCLLVDDLPSELDDRHRQRVGEWMSRLGVQLFVTAVDRAPLLSMWPSSFVSESHLFHVEQGGLKPVVRDH